MGRSPDCWSGRFRHGLWAGPFIPVLRVFPGIVSSMRRAGALATRPELIRPVFSKRCWKRRELSSEQMEPWIWNATAIE